MRGTSEKSSVTSVPLKNSQSVLALLCVSSYDPKFPAQRGSTHLRITIFPNLGGGS
jgi:hypothetical protein